jgi:hypothetical protein
VSGAHSLKAPDSRSDEEEIAPLLLNLIFLMEGKVMASNFGIAVDKCRDGFGLKLAGDFDATSAWELIYAIKKLPEGTIKISIHTNGLKSIFDFGLDVFHRNMNTFDGPSRKIVFTGNNASRLSLGNSCWSA